MIGLPGVERIGRLQHGAVALDRFDLGRDRRHDAVADIVEHGKDVVGPALEGLGPDDPGRAHLDEFDADDQAAGRAAHCAGGDIVDVQPSAGFFRRDVRLGQRKHRSARDDEEIAELGETGDDVVGEPVGQPAARAAALLDKRHHRQRGLAWLDRAGIAGWGCQLRWCGQAGRLRLERAAGPLVTDCLPGRAKRGEIQLLRLEQASRRSQMLFGRADGAALRQIGQQGQMRARVEWRQLDPFVEMRGHFGRARRMVYGKLFQHGGVACVKTAALGDQPAVEKRAALELQPVEQIAGEQSCQRLQLLHVERADPLRGGTADLQRIDKAAVEIERDRIALCRDPAPVRRVERAAQLAQAPAQFAAGIVGHIPQQFAQAAAAHGVRRQRQIGKQRAQLARRRQRHRHAVAQDLQRSEQAHGQAAACRRPASMVRIPRPFPRLLPRWPVGPCYITKHDTAHPAANFRAGYRHCRIVGSQS